jgi:hypothetical protein
MFRGREYKDQVRHEEDSIGKKKILKVGDGSIMVAVY